MATDREERLAQARETFDALSAQGSAVRRLSEATRENDADTYDRHATLNAFEHGLERDVARLGEIAKRFNK